MTADLPEALKYLFFYLKSTLSINYFISTLLASKCPRNIVFQSQKVHVQDSLITRHELQSLSCLNITDFR